MSPCSGRSCSQVGGRVAGWAGGRLLRLTHNPPPHLPQCTICPNTSPFPPSSLPPSLFHTSPPPARPSLPVLPLPPPPTPTLGVVLSSRYTTPSAAKSEITSRVMRLIASGRVVSLQAEGNACAGGAWRECRRGMHELAGGPGWPGSQLGLGRSYPTWVGGA